MSSARIDLAHEERTVKEPRQGQLHSVSVAEIARVNRDIRRYKLKIADREQGIKFQAGQWLDVHVPGLPKAGGFTITSAPEDAQTSTTNADPFLELAIQRSPGNPPAAWLWRPESQIVDSELKVRVGGSFVWPPPGIEPSSIKNAVFVAGGVGINPLISMLKHIPHTHHLPASIHVLYSLSLSPIQTTTSSVLFLDELMALEASLPADTMTFHVFLTGSPDEFMAEQGAAGCSVEFFNYATRRLDEEDLLKAVGRRAEERDGTVCFVCGPPKMTDEIVDFLSSQGGLEEGRVFCEKWW
ncbi:ferredoxin reductase-like protein [Aulographum hederae CBS 113979]|uniref:Oxidoreductase NAD-binding domain-containing protein 1 n=1 Tax=Aulographum hederae CBS 113979 TaxID=1176131 RepID=A0A6G1HF75_9PEZI|nr:ferredoxin reductase-like protein [Aulographum hederae CBS 113979]